MVIQMTIYTLRPRVGKHHNYEIDPRINREFRAQRATALSIDSPLAVDWEGLIKLPGGGLGINDNLRARLKAARLGFAIEGEGGGNG